MIYLCIFLFFNFKRCDSLCKIRKQIFIFSSFSQHDSYTITLQQFTFTFMFYLQSYNRATNSHDKVLGLVRVENGRNTLEKYQFLIKLKHMPTLFHSCFPKRNENINPQKVYKNIYNNLILTGKNWKHLNITLRKIDKLWYIHTTTTKNEQLNSNKMNLKTIIKWKKPNTTVCCMIPLTWNSNTGKTNL